MIVLQLVPSDIKFENHARFFTIGESPITSWGNLCTANDLFGGNGDSMCSTCERFFWIKKTKAPLSMFRIFRNWNTFKNEVEKFSDKAVVLFHYLLLVVSVSGNFLIRSDKCVANFPYYVSLMWAPEAKSSSIGRVGSPQTGLVKKLFYHQ